MEQKLIDEYRLNVGGHIQQVLEYYPLIKIDKIIPLSEYPLYTLRGPLVPKIYLNKYSLSYEDLLLAGEKVLSVYVVIPENYLDKGCKVYDTEKTINWDNVPYKHRHLNGSNEYGNELCTHLPEESRDMDNPILENLHTTYRLFQEYKKFLITGKWKLKEYSHGDLGVKEYENRRMQRKIK